MAPLLDEMFDKKGTCKGDQVSRIIVSQTTADNRWMCKYEYMNKSNQVERVVS